MTAAAVVAGLADHGVRLTAEGSNLRAFGPLTDDDRALIRAHKPALLALLAGAESPPATPADPDPAAHCPACGSPSFWRSPSSPTWRCSYCEPRDRSRIEAHESLTLASGQWAPGCAPPADPDAGEDATGNQAQDRAPLRPADGRVQNAYGAWRTPAAHERIEEYDRHHWTCPTCIRAGRGYGDRCEAGARLHAATRAGR